VASEPGQPVTGGGRRAALARRGAASNAGPAFPAAAAAVFVCNPVRVTSTVARTVRLAPLARFPSLQTAVPSRWIEPRRVTLAMRAPRPGVSCRRTARAVLGPTFLTEIVTGTRSPTRARVGIRLVTTRSGATATSPHTGISSSTSRHGGDGRVPSSPLSGPGPSFVIVQTMSSVSRLSLTETGSSSVPTPDATSRPVALSTQRVLIV
jgi:hypothetical protein